MAFVFARIIARTVFIGFTFALARTGYLVCTDWIARIRGLGFAGDLARTLTLVRTDGIARTSEIGFTLQFARTVTVVFASGFAILLPSVLLNLSGGKRLAREVLPTVVHIVF